MSSVRFLFFTIVFGSIFVSMILFVLFGQLSVRKLRKNPETRDALGIELVSGGDIVNVAQAFAMPRKWVRKLRNAQLPAMIADIDVLYKHTTRFDRVLGTVFYGFLIFSVVAMVSLMICDALGVLDWNGYAGLSIAGWLVKRIVGWPPRGLLNEALLSFVSVRQQVNNDMELTTLLLFSLMMLFVALILYVLFGQINVRRFRKNPEAKHDLGMEFASGLDILKVAGALALPGWSNRKPRSAPLGFLYADAGLVVAGVAAYGSVKLNDVLQENSDRLHDRILDAVGP